MYLNNLLSKPQMRKFYIIFLLFSMLVVSPTGYIYASGFQGITVTGAVQDEYGDVLPGVNVLEKGTINGVVTDVSGRFTITVAGANSVLQFSFIGFTTQEAIVGDQRIFSIQLKEDAQSLSEVVVIGYGTQQKRDITGSVAVVDTKELQKSTGSSALEQLQGKASGVYVSTSGAPGGRSMVRIRGVNTVNDNGPLYVIDGVSTQNQDLSTLNSGDIESMQILKDATASAIYGAQAANGVILITTKKGSRSGQPVLSYNGYFGIQKTGKRYDLLNSEERMRLEFTMQRNNLEKAYEKNAAGQAVIRERDDDGVITSEDLAYPSYRLFEYTPNGFVPHKYIATAGLAGAPNYGDQISAFPEYSYPYNAIAEFSDTDWWDEVSRTAPVQNHQFSISGGGDKGMYNMSMNVYDEQSVLKWMYYKRYSTRLNTSFDIRPWLRVGENLMFTWTKDLGRVNTANESNIFSWVYRAIPYLPVRDIAGNYTGSRFPDTGNWENPVSLIERQKDNYWSNNRLFGDVWAEVDLLKGLTFRSQYGLDYTQGYYYRISKKNLEFNESTRQNDLEESANFRIRWQWSNTLTYRTVINQIHRLTVLAGTEAINGGFGRTLTGQRYGYDFEDDMNTWILNMGGNDNQRRAESYWGSEYAIFSIFGRVDYALMDKYLLTVNVRRDGVSRFSPDYRYGTFPSMSLAWRLSEEGFMMNTRSWLDDFKLRAGWGKVGNAEGPSSTNWANEFGMSTNNGNYDLTGTNTGITAFRQSRIGNLNTKWETVETYNVGFDALLLKGRFGLSFEYYSKKTNDMLVPASYTYLAGDADAPYINFGDMENKGFDISLNYNDSRGDFGWDVTLTAFHYKNKVTRLSETDDTGYARYESGDRIGSITRTKRGEPISHFFGYKVDGVYENVQQVRALLPVGVSAAAVATSPVTGDIAAENWVGRFKYEKTSDDNPGSLGPADRVVIGNPHPKLLASLNVGLTYKNFDFTMFWYSSIGNDLFNNTKAFTDFNQFRGNRSKRMLNQSWEPGRTFKKPGEKASSSDAILPQLNSADGYSWQVANSYFVENASYLRLKNLVLGYTLPKSWLQPATIQNLRVYVQMENLITITKYNGLNPEMTLRDMSSGSDLARGIDGGGFPNIIKYIFGVNLTF